MARYDLDFHFLVASARRAIRQQLDRQRVPDPKQPRRGQALADHVAATLTAIERRITHSEARFGAATTDAEYEAAVATMRLLNGFLRHMQEAGPWIDAAADPELHIGPLYFVDEAARVLVSSDCDVVVVPDAAYGYATLSWPFETILKKLGQTVVGSRPVVVFFPPEETSSLLLHALFVHELGHPAVLEHKLLDRVIGTTAGDPSFATRFDKAVTDFAAAFSGDPAEARFILNRRLHSWVTELLCDALATAYVGPAYVFAFAAVVASTSSAEIPKDHPPTSLRLRIMLDQLKRRRWIALLRTRIPNVLAWLEYVASMASGPLVSHAQFLVDATTELAPEVRRASDDLLRSNVYRPKHYGAVGSEVESYLQHRILPAQLQDGAAPDRRSILLAGWMHVFGDDGIEGNEGDAATSLPVGLMNHDFQEFLSKGLEMSAVLETWRSV